MDFGINGSSTEMLSTAPLDDVPSSDEEEEDESMFNSSNMMAKKKTEKAKWTADEVCLPKSCTFPFVFSLFV